MKWAADDRFAIAGTWRGRGGALLRFVIFIVLFVAANLALNYALADVQRKIETPEGHFLLAMSAIGVAVLLLTAAMARFNGQRFSHYGYGGPHKSQNFAIGIGLGTFFVAAQLVVLSWLGFLTWGPAVLSGSLLLPGAICAALFLVVGFTEESLFRGYALVELSRAISFWPAALLLAGLFGAMHGLKGGGENVVGGLQATAAAIAFAFSFRATGSLWLAIGCHAGWDFAQSFVFGVPDSGTVTAGHILQPAIHGPDLLTGGAAGPEGSVLAFFLPMAIALVSWRLGRPGVTGDKQAS